MPRPVPSGHADALSKLYGAGSLPGMSSSAGVGAPAFVGDSREIAKNVADKANQLYAAAQQKEKAGKLAEAESMYRMSAGWRERVWGTKDPAVFVIYGRIAELCKKMNKLPEAEAAYRRQNVCGVRIYGAGAFEVTPVLNKLGDCCFTQNKLPDAISAYRQVYILRKRKLGDANEETLDIQLKLARALKMNGAHQEAQKLVDDGLKIIGTSTEGNSVKLKNGFDEVLATAPPAASPEGVAVPVPTGVSTQPAGVNSALSTTPTASPTAPSASSAASTTSTTSTTTTPATSTTTSADKTKTK